MKIALAHFRVGETDGVSLEMEKWKATYEGMGHEVVMLAGSEGQSNAYVIDELHYRHPANLKFVENAYKNLRDYESADALKTDMLQFASTIEEKLVQFIEEENIDLLIPNNILSLGWNLPAGVAFTHAVDRTKVKTICHHHDFHWEREKYQNPTASFVSEWLERYFPPVSPFISHVVINSLAKDELKKRYGVDAKVVPNVFDFEREPWNIDDYNADFRQAFDIKEDDIFILQATRITERKAIELGIDFIAKLQSSLSKGMTLYNGQPIKDSTEVVYVLAGLEEAEPDYIKALNQKAEELGVDLRWINHSVDHSRWQKDNGNKVYSLWDAYAACDFITYPSILEGWGNQLLEGMFAKKPLLVYEYPVFERDIKQSGIKYPSLGSEYDLSTLGLVEVNEEVMDKAVEDAVGILTTPEVYEDVVETNFRIGKEKYSYEALKRYLENVLEKEQEAKIFRK
ncbi:glycosyltransferase family 4 protein [Halobacillus sp. BBL2006]|uniref:glycosyltransferase family 4 protein n=1 Tax=Halobacillus sp. BBL2006 TaxID=1543706 RepID=UPI0005435CCB|nr:glycosyltransferase family 4 protein [Halobacillus sp. BBL2006]KHE72639.1 glycosyl transferase family 1 [Halobacillus sp. BBL2006]